MNITGAELFVKALRAEHVDTLFAYPGGQVIDLFNALYDEEAIQVILPRHEQGLIHAADGYARSTGKPGVCLVTSGPGATNLVTGIATAHYDSVPLVCFTGQVPTGLIGSHAFQEVDIVSITSSICKYAISVRRREDLSSIIRNAFTIARTGRPGVVVVDLPKDIQREYGSSNYPDSLPAANADRLITPPPASLSVGMERALKLLNRAKKPVLLIGGGVNISRAHAELLQFVEITGIPVVTTIMGKGAIPSTHNLYIGNLGIHGSYAANMAIQNCDVLLAIGTRFNDRITGAPGTFASHAAIIHIDIDPASVAGNVAADIPLVADAKKALRTLLDKAIPLHIQEWINEIHQWKTQHPVCVKTKRLNPEMIIQTINHAFDRAIIATDVGQNQLWATQFLTLNMHRQLLTSGGLGTMGYGLPAAIGAKIGNPDTDVIVIAGDGGIQMTIQELATAIVYELPITICIFNNGYLGNVRQWQEMFYDRRYASTCMRYRISCMKNCNSPAACCPEYTPDFISLAQSYGVRGIRVTKEEEILPALEAARDTLKIPTLIEFIIEPEENVLPIVSPGKALDGMILDYDSNRLTVSRSTSSTGSTT